MSVGNQAILAPELELNQGLGAIDAVLLTITASSLLSLSGIHSSPISHDRRPVLQPDIAKDTKQTSARRQRSFCSCQIVSTYFGVVFFFFFCRLIILCLPVFVWFPISISVLLLHAKWDHNGSVCYDFTALTSGCFSTHSLRISRDSSVILVFLSCLLVTVFNIFIYISYTLGFLFV